MTTPRSLPARALMAAIRGYQSVSIVGQPRCRFDPTCSHYAAEAVASHGAARGSWMAVRRLGRCHPWGGHGYDPVPPVAQAHSSADDSARSFVSS